MRTRSWSQSLSFSNLWACPVLKLQSFYPKQPTILVRSLEKQIIPCVQELRQILGTDENVLKAIKAGYGLIQANVEKVLKPNLMMLIRRGVPQSLALKLFFLGPQSLLMNTYRFSEIVSEVMKLGFDPNKLQFVIAIRSMAMTKTLWEQKVEAYRSFGLSKIEIYSAFKRQPLFMATSKKKIKKSMGFFVNKLKIKPSLVSKNPILIQFSLEKRIIPRCSVLQLLISKRLIKEDTSIFHAIRMTENKFVEKLVSKYQNEVPDVVRVHQGKIEFQGFPIDLKMWVIMRSSNAMGIAWKSCVQFVFLVLAVGCFLHLRNAINCRCFALALYSLIHLHHSHTVQEMEILEYSDYLGGWCNLQK
jgi:mTERF domain-containing protein